MRLAKWMIGAMVLFAIPAVCQQTGGGGHGGVGVCTTTVSGLNSCVHSKGTLATVTDGTTTSDCTTGGGSNVVTCIYNGTAWTFAGNSGSNPTFAQVGAGTNTGALLVGTGGSMATTGTGTISSTSLGGVVSVNGAQYSTLCSAMAAVAASPAANAVVIDSLKYEQWTQDPFANASCGNGVGGYTIFFGSGVRINGTGGAITFSSQAKYHLGPRGAETEVNTTNGCGTATPTNCQGSLFIAYTTAAPYTGGFALTCVSCTAFPVSTPMFQFETGAYGTSVDGGTISTAGVSGSIGIRNTTGQENVIVDGVGIRGAQAYDVYWSSTNAQNSYFQNIEALSGSVTAGTGGIGAPTTLVCFYVSVNAPNRTFGNSTCNHRGTVTTGNILAVWQIVNSRGGRFSDTHGENFSYYAIVDQSSDGVYLNNDYAGTNIGSAPTAFFLLCNGASSTSPCSGTGNPSTRTNIDGFDNITGTSTTAVADNVNSVSLAWSSWTGMYLQSGLNMGAGTTGSGAFVRATSPTITSVILNGSPSGTGVSQTGGPGTLVQRDGNNNAVANNFLSSASVIATAAGTTTLTVGSSRYQMFTGTTTQTVQLPNATTLAVGTRFVINNNSTGTVTVTDGSGATLTTVGNLGDLDVVLQANGTTAGTWDTHPWLSNGATSGSAGTTLPGNLTVNGLTGGPFCLHETSGVISATASDCGSSGGSGTVSSSTAGYIAQYTGTGASTTVGTPSPLLDNGVTTASTLTYAGTGGITASAGPLASASDGTHAGGVAVAGNTTEPTLPSNSFIWGAPLSASFTSFGWNPPTAENASAGLLHVAAASSHWSALTVSLVANSDLVNSATTVNGQSCALGGSCSITGVSGGLSFTQTVASGTAAMGTTAISSGTCATVVTVAATGVATTDTITYTPNADPTGVTGYAVSATGSLYVWAYPTSGNVNFKVCNNTSGSLTPGALTFNWRVTR